MQIAAFILWEALKMTMLDILQGAIWTAIGAFLVIVALVIYNMKG